MRIERVIENDIEEVQQIASSLDGLFGHPVHLYRIMQLYFGDSFFVAREKERIIGFVLGFKSQMDEGSTWFLWQIGVTEDNGGKGIGKQLVGKCIQWATEQGCARIHATVETSNILSQRLFESLGFSIVGERYGSTINKNGKPALVNWYGSGTDQYLFEYEL